MKQNKMKKLVTSVVLVAMTAALFAGCGDKKSSEPEHIEGSAGLEYTLSDDESYYIMTGRGTCTDKDVVIGNWHEGKPVKEIGAQAANIEFQQELWAVDTITVSEGITKFNFGSLWGTEASKIVLPDGVEELAHAMLQENNNLKEVVIGKGLKSVGPDVFENMIVDTIYFRGSEEEWNQVEINSKGNETLTESEIVFDYKE